VLEPEKVKQILQMDDAQRAVYFVNETVTQNQLWILTDEHGCVMLNTEDEDCVPVWPNEEFAQAWATEQWQDCRPEAISLNKWFSRWTHGLADDELAIVVFPSQDEQGLVYYPDELEHELKQKQHSVKKR
jgi:glycosidase|tara:strand:- start:24069 stop:24458 length:390 start_codon:yes stop_codon:yes gene_type:complete